jgi:hypothetical protein
MIENQELKVLSPQALPAALEKALRYRLLNEPEQAASICEDVLAVEPENQEAVVTLILARSDQFGGPRPVSPQSVRDLLTRLRGEYEREYYSGILWEREAVARLRSNAPRSGAAAYDCFRQALECFSRAEALRPPGNDDALLRWNSCVRMIAANPDVAPADEGREVAPLMGD